MHLIVSRHRATHKFGHHHRDVELSLLATESFISCNGGDILRRWLQSHPTMAAPTLLLGVAHQQKFGQSAIYALLPVERPAPNRVHPPPRRSYLRFGLRSRSSWHNRSVDAEAPEEFEPTVSSSPGVRHVRCIKGDGVSYVYIEGDNKTTNNVTKSPR